MTCATVSAWDSGVTSSSVVHAMPEVRGLGTDVDVISGNPDVLVIWATEVLAGVDTWSGEVDSFGGNVGLEPDGAMERDFSFVVATDCIFLDVVAGVGDIAGWRGGVAAGIYVSG